MDERVEFWAIKLPRMATSSIIAGHTQKSCAILRRVDAYGVFQSVYSIFILAQFLEYSSTL